MRLAINIFILAFIFNLQQAQAQLDVIELINPSFEDKPHLGNENKYGQRSQIRGWYDCSQDDFPYESPPDIHPKNFWNVTVKPFDGQTYLGMVVREQESWESISQHLSTKIKRASCYIATVKLARSDNYLSFTREDVDDLNILTTKKVKKENFTEPTVLRVWGGAGKCHNKQLLWESPPIDHSDWREYKIQFESKFTHSFITLEAYYKTPNLFAYNGHILIDNLTDFKEYNCKIGPQELDIVKEDPKKVKPITDEKEAKTKVNTPTKTEVVTNKKKEEKLIKDLDRNALKIGQTIEINNLYFAANEAAITNASYAVLNEVYSFMKSYTDVVIEIGGHTNSIPKDEFCDKLSRDRAKSVARYLVAKGIPAARVQFKGYGKRNPIASNENASGRKKNQRVEIKILSLDN